MKFETPFEQLFLTTTLLRVERGGTVGLSSGFLFTHETEQGSAPFLVTNKHAVSGAEKGSFYFREEGKDEPLHVTMNEFGGRFFGHPDENVDIAVMPLAPALQELAESGRKPIFRSLSAELIPGKEQQAQLNPMEEVVVFDYPSGLIDPKLLLPLTRRGILASPITEDFGGVPIYMVSLPMFPCSGGAPVLLCNTAGFIGPQGFVPEVRILFLGVLSQVALRNEEGGIEMANLPNAPIPAGAKRQITDLGAAYRAETVQETISAFLDKVGVKEKD